MFLSKTYTPSNSLQFLWLSKLSFSMFLILMVLSFPVFAQEGKDELPAPFFGNWVEDLSECNGLTLFSFSGSDEGLLVSGIDWYSSEVKVKNDQGFYNLLIQAYGEEGEFELDINLKMGEDGSLIYFFPGLEETQHKLVKCDPTEFIESESEEMTLADSELNILEFDMDNSLALDTFAIELLQGKWQSVEDKFSFMVIEGDRMKTYYKRMEDGMEDELIIISDTCMNELDSENDLPKEKNRYISQLDMDMCWYIDNLDANNLSLIYMARGNYHTYRRVK